MIFYSLFSTMKTPSKNKYYLLKKKEQNKTHNFSKITKS